MGGKSNIITLTVEKHEYLDTQSCASTIQAQTINRTHSMFLKADGCYVDDITDKIGINRKSVIFCMKKVAEGGKNALFDAPGCGAMLKLQIIKRRGL